MLVLIQTYLSIDNKLLIYKQALKQIWTYNHPTAKVMWSLYIYKDIRISYSEAYLVMLLFGMPAISTSIRTSMQKVSTKNKKSCQTPPTAASPYEADLLLDTT